MSSDNISEILEAVNPEEFFDYLGVNYRLTTGKSGTQMQVKECPRCHGNKWKVYINAETGIGNCFHGTCVGEPGFNLFSFAANQLGGGKEAYKELAEFAKECGWRPKKPKKLVNVEQNATTVSVTLPESIALPQGNKNHPYLINRGFTLETTAHFDWRFCKKGRFDYVNHEGKNCWQLYDDRIIIPIYDLDGNLVTFQGRDITGKAEKKYLFPAGLPGTAKFLYNGHNAVGVEEIVINEGALDVAATYQALKEDLSLTHVVPVGTFGKSLTMSNQDSEDQLSALFRLKEAGLKVITLMWDTERKTLLDAATTCEKLISLGFVVRLATLPLGKDPNEATPQEVRNAYYNAMVMNKARLLRYRRDAYACRV